MAGLVRIRKDRGLTQRDLAGILGVPHCYVARMEIKERRLDVIELISVLKAIGVSKKEIIGILAKLV